MSTATRPTTFFSYLTGEYSVEFTWDDLTSLMDEVFAVWDSLKLDRTDEAIGNGFDALVGHIAALREWTGWGWVPEKFTIGDNAS